MRTLLIGLAAWICLSAIACGQDYPARTIFLIVGPGPDAVARLVAQKLGEALGQQVLIDLQPGAGGLVAERNVAKAAPDGYTLLLTTGSYSINEALRPSASLSLLRDLAPVVEIGSLSFVLVVPPSFAVHTLADLVRLAREQPGEINCASSGVGTTAHLGCEMLNRAAGIRTVHVPYKGAAGALTDLLAGRVQLTFAVPTILQHVKSGNLRALAVTGPLRLAALPDIPTVAEAGFPELTFTSWNGVHAPAGTPTGVIDRLNGEIRRARDLPEFQQRMVELGYTPEGGRPDQFAEFVKADVARWSRIVKDTGVKVQ